MQDDLLRTSFAWEWVPQTWRLFSRSKLRVFGLAFVFFLVTMVTSLFPVFGPVVSGFLTPFLMMGSIKALHSLDQGEELRIGDLFIALSDSERFRRALPMGITIGVLYAGTAVAFFVIKAVYKDLSPALFLGIFAIIGLYSVILTILGYGPALVEMQKMPSRRAMEASLTLTIKNWWPLLLVGVVYGFCVIAAIIPLGLGLFILFPMAHCIPYIVYKETFRNAETQ